MDSECKSSALALKAELLHSEKPQIMPMLSISVNRQKTFEKFFILCDSVALWLSSYNHFHLLSIKERTS